jgi:small GTP-binding protein
MALHEIKLCFLGQGGVGKTCIAYRFVHDKFSEFEIPTVGASFSSKRVEIDEKNILFHIWDTAGQEKYRSLAPMYYRGAAAAVIVYDITDPESFEKMKGWIQELKRLASPGITLAVVGNKCDMEESREINTDMGKAYADSIDAIFFETSAKSGENIEQLFEEIGMSIAIPPPLPLWP